MKGCRTVFCGILSAGGFAIEKTKKAGEHNGSMDHCRGGRESQRQPYHGKGTGAHGAGGGRGRGEISNGRAGAGDQPLCRKGRIPEGADGRRRKPAGDDPAAALRV